VVIRRGGGRRRRHQEPAFSGAGRKYRFVDAIVELGQDREEAIDEAVDDPIEQQRGPFDRLLSFCVASTCRRRCSTSRFPRKEALERAGRRWAIAPDGGG
jgi:hypothetical protein